MPFFPFDGHKVFYEVSGSGTPLLYLHGWNESSTHFRRHVAPRIESDLLVMTIDLPGFGESEFFEISYRVISKLIAAFIEYMELSQITLAGFCLGGTFALDFAISYPQFVNRVFLIDVTLDYPLSLNSPLTPMIGRQILRFFLKTKIGNRITAKQLQAKGVQKKDFYTAFKDTDIAISHHYLTVVREYSRLNHYRRVAAATFDIHCITGEFSSKYVKESMNHLVSLVPNATLYMIKGAGHFILDERPIEVVKFLQEI